MTMPHDIIHKKILYVYHCKKSTVKLTIIVTTVAVIYMHESFIPASANYFKPLLFYYLN